MYFKTFQDGLDRQEICYSFRNKKVCELSKINSVFSYNFVDATISLCCKTFIIKCS